MKYLFVILLAIFLSFAACKTVKEYVPLERVVRETVTLRDTIISVKLVQIHDSVSINLSKDTLSYLENQYAYSYAMITGGNLVHSLGTQEASLPVKTEYIEVIRTDSIPFIRVVTLPGKEVVIHKPTFLQFLQHLAAGIVIGIAGIMIFLVFKR
jgi:hypothetical protein